MAALPGVLFSLDDPHADDAPEVHDVLNNALVHPGAKVYHGVGVITPGLVGHVLHVHMVLCKKGRDIGQHGGDIAVDNTKPLHAAAVHVDIGEIDGVFDIAVFKVVLQLVNGHGRAVLLALRGGGAQVGHGDDMMGPDQLVIGEVGDIGGHLAGIQGGEHGLVLHDLTPGQVNEPRAPLHLANGLGVNHVAGLIGIMDVDGNIIRPLVKLIDVLDNVHMAVQTQRRVHGQEGIVAEDVHAKVQGDVGNQRADGAKADDAQGLFIKLRSDEGGLSLFDNRGDVHTALHLFTDPVDAAGNIPGGHEQRAQHQFLHGVGVGAGSVEHGDARFRAAVDGDIVHAHAGAGNGFEVCGECVVQQLGGADEDTVLTLHTVSHIVIRTVEAVQAHGRDLVERFDLVHGKISSLVAPADHDTCGGTCSAGAASVTAHPLYSRNFGPSTYVPAETAFCSIKNAKKGKKM